MCCYCNYKYDNNKNLKGGGGFMKPCKRCLTNRMQLLKTSVVIESLREHPTSREKPESAICSGSDPLCRMVKTCCVIGCSNRGGRDKVSFFQFPTVIESQGKATKELSSRRRDLWIASVKRKDWMPTAYSYVCSDHFSSSKCILLLVHVYSRCLCRRTSEII